MHSDEPVLPGRLERLAAELHEEGVPALLGAPDRLASLVELSYALRPPVHEGRVPTYGAFVVDQAIPDGGLAGMGVDLIDVEELDTPTARTFADGMTTFAVRCVDTITKLACFDRKVAEEQDLVVLQQATGSLIVQRHPSGQVRVFGPAGVVRWDGIAWYHEPPINRWIKRLAAEVDGLPVDGLRPLLTFAVHELSGRRIGAILVWRPLDATPPPDGWEPHGHHFPSLSLRRTGQAAAIAHALAQTDGATIFNASAELVALGVRLAPSSSSQNEIGVHGGTRHTSALRYSADDPEAILVVVSDDGPVTVMHAGNAILTADPLDPLADEPARRA